MEVWVWRDGGEFVVSPRKPEEGRRGCEEPNCQTCSGMSSYSHSEAIYLCGSYGLFKRVTNTPKKFELTAKEIS